MRYTPTPTDFSAGRPFRAFEGENIQKHVLYMGHSTLFKLKEPRLILLRMVLDGNAGLDDIRSWQWSCGNGKAFSLCHHFPGIWRQRTSISDRSDAGGGHRGDNRIRNLQLMDRVQPGYGHSKVKPCHNQEDPPEGRIIRQHIRSRYGFLQLSSS